MDIAMCSLSPVRIEAFLREDVVAKHPQLIFVCLPRCTGMLRRILFEGLLRSDLVAKSRDLLDGEAFAEFVEYAVAKGDIQELLAAALRAGELAGAGRLLELFAHVHRLPCLEDVVVRAGEGGGGGLVEVGSLSDAATYLLSTLDALRTSEATACVYDDFVKQLCGKAT